MKRRLRSFGQRTVAPARGVTLLAFASVLASRPAAGADEAGRRWPTWPTEVSRAAAALHEVGERGSGERERVAAIAALERFATPVIEHEIVRATDDPSAQIRREALRVCYERRMLSCVPAAASIWSRGIEPTLRIAALRVMALDPDPSRLAILLDALRDPSEQLRAQAAVFLGWAPLQGQARTQARAALVAKLSDGASLVRKRAVESLGLLGVGQGTLPVARLLEDPEPAVRSAAAEALGRARDPRAVPAVLRAIHGQNETVVAQAILESLAQLPGSSVATELLRLLDAPPDGLSADQIAEAIGLRPLPESVLIDGLIERAREVELRDACLRALLLLAEPTRPALVAALEHGVEPSLELELIRLRDALDEPTSAPPTDDPWPGPGAERDWAERLDAGSWKDRFEAASVLADTRAPWSGPAILARIEAAPTLAVIRPWLVTLARASTMAGSRGRWLPWAKLVGWAHDGRLGAADRCLAISALGRVGTADRKIRRRVHASLLALLDDRLAEVRACVAMTAAQFGNAGVPVIELGLADADPRARVAAALALAETGASLPASLMGRLALLAQSDSHAQVRAAADHALRRRRGGAPTSRPTLLLTPAPALPWARSDGWIALDVPATHSRGEPQRLWVPALGRSEIRWALVPGLSAAVPIKNAPR